MPRNSRAPKRRIDTPPPLTHDESAILLNGFSAKAPGDGDGLAVGFWMFNGDTVLIDAWRQHERFLRTLAAAWGWAPAWWVTPVGEPRWRFVVREPAARHEGPFYFGEALAVIGEQSLGAGASSSGRMQTWIERQRELREGTRL